MKRTCDSSAYPYYPKKYHSNVFLRSVGHYLIGGRDDGVEAAAFLDSFLIKNLIYIGNLSLVFSQGSLVCMLTFRQLSVWMLNYFLIKRSPGGCTSLCASWQNSLALKSPMFPLTQYSHRLIVVAIKVLIRAERKWFQAKPSQTLAF